MILKEFIHHTFLYLYSINATILLSLEKEDKPIRQIGLFYRQIGKFILSSAIRGDKVRY